MATQTRKQREIQEREILLLQIARKIFLNLGYHGLTMARVAEAADYSKGTIYQHFSCKEEIIIALAIESVEKQRDLVERAAAFRGRPRERILAIAMATDLFSRVYPEDSRIFQIVNGEAITQKASKDSLERLRSAGMRSVSIMAGILQDAVVQGDLKLPEGHTPEDLIYHFWLLGEAGKAASSSWLPPQDIGVGDVFTSLIKTNQLVVDGYGWRPLSTEWDYGKTRDRIQQEIFPEEGLLACGS